MNLDGALFLWIVAGAGAALCYRLAVPVKDWLKARFTTRVMVTSAEEVYYWLIKWVDAQSVWASSYQIRMLSHSVKDLRTASTWEDEHRDAVLGPGPGVWWFKFERRWWWCQLEHRHRENADRPIETINIGCIGRHHDALQRLIDAASEHNQPPDGAVRLFRHRGGGWEPPILRYGRQWSTLTLPPAAAALLDDAKRFYDSANWYRSRGIPWRRGYLLHGEPGTGKSSFVHALATELNRDIYLLSLSGLNDAGLEHLMCTMPEGVIVAIEDIDIAQPSRRRSGGSQTDDSTPTGDGLAASDALGVTLGGLLNALDGIIASEGRLLICTTNHPDCLDAALTRAGRCDLHVELPKADAATRSDIQRRITGHDGWSIDIEDPTPADVQEAAIARVAAGHDGIYAPQGGN